MVSLTLTRKQWGYVVLALRTLTDIISDWGDFWDGDEQVVALLRVEDGLGLVNSQHGTLPERIVELRDWHYSTGSDSDIFQVQVSDWDLMEIRHAIGFGQELAEQFNRRSGIGAVLETAFKVTESLEE